MGRAAWRYTRNQAQEITTRSSNSNAYLWADASACSRNYAANGLNQYTTVATQPIGHDANGNLTSDGVWTYAYDLDNRLKTASRAGLSASLNYDAAGRLRRTSIGGAVTDLLYDGVDLVAEYNGANALKRRYVHGPGIDEPLVWYEGSGTGNKNWLYADHLGSIVASANGAGSSTATYSYGPYGEPNQTTGSRFRYTGQQLIGELGLYYYKARLYSSARGRFLQTDPIGYADDLNLYAYVRNNSINFNDPFGKDAVTLGMSVRVPLLGVGINIGGFATGVPFMPEATPESFDLGVYGSATPGLFGDAYGYFFGDSTTPDFSKGVDGGRLTVDARVQWAGRDALDGLGLDIFAGVSSYGATLNFDAGGNNNINLPSKDFPTGVTFNVGPQLRGAAALNVGKSLSVGDAFKGLYGVVDWATDGWLSSVSGSSKYGDIASSRK